MGRRDKRRREERQKVPKASGGGASGAGQSQFTEEAIVPEISIEARRTAGPVDAIVFAAGTFLVAGFYLVLKAYALNPYAGDEHIYLFQAKLVSDGYAPYRDFFMAHPPFQALFTAALFKVAGYHFLLGRLLPVLVTLAGGLGLAFMARREMGAPAAVAAMAISLLSYEPLRASSHYTGVETAVSLLVFAWLFARRGRMIPAALFCVAAVMTRLYAVPGVLALVTVTLLEDRRKCLVLVAAGAALGALAFCALGLWTGFGPLFHDVFLYHAEKTAMAADELANMKAGVLFHNAVPVALCALGVPALLASLSAAWKRARERKRPLVRLREAAATSGAALPLAGAFAAFLILALLLNMDRVWMYYFVPAFPFGALAGGFLVASWIRGAVRLVKSRFSPCRAGMSGLHIAGGVLLFAAFAAVFAFGHLLERNLSYFEKEAARESDGPDRVYAWRDAALLPSWLNGAVRAILWRDERVLGDPYSSFTYDLWHESRVLDIADAAVAEIRDRTSEGDAIFGDSGTVPLLALLSGRDIAGREVDTNVQRYRSGNADPAQLVARIDAPTTRIIFLRNRFGVAGLSEIQTLVREKYAFVKKFSTSEGQTFQMFERRPTGEAAR